MNQVKTLTKIFSTGTNTINVNIITILTDQVDQVPKTMAKVAKFTATNGIIPFQCYAERSPMLAYDDVEMTFVFAHAKSICALHALFSTGDVPTDADILFDWQNLDKYLDVPILFQISNHKKWQDKGDENLWLFKLQGYKQYQVYNANWAAENGQLETLKWIRANGGEWTDDAADYAAKNGQLETLKWIRANGGEWTSNTANWAAANGHLETLQWIRANGGEWTDDAADFAAQRGHLDTLKWIHANGGKWTVYAVRAAAQNNHGETLDWIIANEYANEFKRIQNQHVNK